MIRRFVTAIPWIAVTVSVLINYSFYRWPRGNDFRVYWTGGKAILNGESLYGFVVNVESPFTYSPFAGLAFTVFARLGEVHARYAFALISLFALAASALLIARQLPTVAGRQLPWGLWGTSALVFAGALWLDPVLSGYRAGQIGVILMLLILLDASWSNRWTGIATGIATAIKITPAIFMLLMLTTRRWLDATRVVAAFAVTVVIGFLILPDDSWEYWTDLLFETDRVGGIAVLGNFSLDGYVSRILPHGATAIWLISSLVILALGLWIATRWWQHSPLMATTIVGVVGTIVAPISWVHHWVWFVPAIALLAALGIKLWDSASRSAAIVAWSVSAITLAVMVARPYSYLFGQKRSPTPFGTYVVEGSFLAVAVAFIAVAWVGIKRVDASD